MFNWKPVNIAPENQLLEILCQPYESQDLDAIYISKALLKKEFSAGRGIGDSDQMVDLWQNETGSREPFLRVKVKAWRPIQEQDMTLEKLAEIRNRRTRCLKEWDSKRDELNALDAEIKTFFGG